MSISHEKIYDRYRNADFTDRLYIFLQFPELRQGFLEIDQKETTTDFFHKALPQDKALKRCEIKTF